MARYFKFHALADIDTEARRLGLDLRFSEDLSPLFRPARVGPFTAGNRLCVQPMEGCDGTLDGQPDELTLRRYQRYGAGGAKLIWAEAAAVLGISERTVSRRWISARLKLNDLLGGQLPT